MNDFLTKLANASSERASSEHLKLLGKRAAGIFSSGEAPSLNAAVTRVVESEALNKEQVSRITETANQETWKALFVENGERQIHFEPADAGAVLGELSSKPDVLDSRKLDALDFEQDVPTQRLPDVDLAEVFGVKSNTPEYEALSTTTEALQTVEKTSAAVDVARYGVDNAASLLAEAGEKFYHLVKQAHLNDGYGVLQISKAVATVLEDPTFAKDVMQKIAARLQSDGVKFNERVELEKVSHVLVVNHEHPLSQAAANFEQAAYAYYSSSEAHEKLAQAHRKATQTLRQKARTR